MRNTRPLGRSWQRRRARLTTFAVLAGICGGCGDGRPRTYPVEGIVQFADGRPVPTGTVEFRYEADGRTARGKLDPRGRFKLSTFRGDDGAVAGQHRVVVIQHFDPAVWRTGGVEPAAADEPHDHELLLVHRRYADYATSELTATVEPRAKNSIELVVGKPVRKADARSR